MLPNPPIICSDRENCQGKLAQYYKDVYRKPDRASIVKKRVTLCPTTRTRACVRTSEKARKGWSKKSCRLGSHKRQQGWPVPHDRGDNKQ
jgi:hypothetical protein